MFLNIPYNENIIRVPYFKADTMLKGFNGVRLEKNIKVHISRSTGTNSTTLSVVLWRVVAHTRSVPLPITRRWRSLFEH